MESGRTDLAHETEAGATNKLGSTSGKAGKSDQIIGSDKAGLTIDVVD